MFYSKLIWSSIITTEKPPYYTFHDHFHVQINKTETYFNIPKQTLILLGKPSTQVKHRNVHRTPAELHQLIIHIALSLHFI